MIWQRERIRENASAFWERYNGYTRWYIYTLSFEVWLSCFYFKTSCHIQPLVQNPVLDATRPNGLGENIEFELPILCKTVSVYKL